MGSVVQGLNNTVPGWADRRAASGGAGPGIPMPDMDRRQIVRCGEACVAEITGVDAKLGHARKLLILWAIILLEPKEGGAGRFQGEADYAVAGQCPVISGFAVKKHRLAGPDPDKYSRSRDGLECSGGQ